MSILTILLTILKTLGIVLLVILSLLLLLILLVLFCPLRYRVRGQKEGGAIDCGARVCWLFPLIRAEVGYTKPEEGEGIVSYAVRVLFIKVFPRGEKTEKSAEHKKKKPKVKKAEEVSAPAEDKDAGKAPGGEESPEKETALSDDKNAGSDASAKKEITPMEDEKKSFFEKLGEFFEFIFELPERIEEGWESFCNSAGSKAEWLQKRYAIIDTPQAERALKAVIGTLKKLILHILPRKGKVLLSFGMEDPADTGRAVGYYSMFYPYVGRWLLIAPDYEDAHFDAHGEAKGRIRVISVLIPALRLWFNKDFQYLKKQYEKLD